MDCDYPFKKARPPQVALNSVSNRLPHSSKDRDKLCHVNTTFQAERVSSRLCVFNCNQSTSFLLSALSILPGLVSQ